MAFLPGGLAPGSQEAGQRGSPEELRLHVKTGLRSDPTPAASQLCDLRQAACLLWALSAPSAKQSLKVLPLAEQQCTPSRKQSAQQRRCLAQATSCHRAVGTAVCPQLAARQPDMWGPSRQQWGIKILAHRAQCFSFSFQLWPSSARKSCPWLGHAILKLSSAPVFLHPACLQPVAAARVPMGGSASGEPRAVGLISWRRLTISLGLNLSLNEHGTWGKLLGFSVPQFAYLQDGVRAHLFPSFSIHSAG